jgi:hypothetical protein
MTDKKKNEVAKYNISADLQAEVRKVLKKKGKTVNISYEDQEGLNNNWQVLARAALSEGAPRMNNQGLEICAAIAKRFSPTIGQKKALVAIARQHCPNVFNNIRLEGQRIE